MKIHGITTCVNYSQYLEQSIELWKEGLDRMVVVTDNNDGATQALCHRHQVPCQMTDDFYVRGCDFNKAFAMEGALNAISWDDWVLFFDADIIPPKGWKETVEKYVVPGNIYGAERELDDGEIKHEGEIAGFFHLFHGQDLRVQERPLLDHGWKHAGGYDSMFQSMWEPTRRKILPIVVRHLGPHGENWCGVGNKEKMEEYRRLRTKGPDRFKHERLTP